MKIFVTGGSGFIGSALIRLLIKNTNFSIVNIDKLTYAGNISSHAEANSNPRFVLENIDICNKKKIDDLFSKYQPDAVMHLAAESHVDRSIDSPSDFINTNVIGTFCLLESAREYLENLEQKKADLFRFHHISTDEVYGDLGDTNDFFTEDTPYDPSSPYSATKAASDHLVRAWSRTFKLPVLITNCSNNYGPYHFPEKLIPHVIIKALNGESIPVYGDGSQIRDWLYVDDHVEALLTVLKKGSVGNTYNIGGNNEKRNIDVVKVICDILDELASSKRPKTIKSFRELIKFVKDRPGHDKRYAIDASKIQKDLGWKPKETFESGIRKTIQWYLDNQSWYEKILSGDYKFERIGK